MRFYRLDACRKAILRLFSNWEFEGFYARELGTVNVILPEFIGAEDATIGEKERLRRNLAANDVLLACRPKEKAAAPAA
jgi:hypothetical protein